MTDNDELLEKMVSHGERGGFAVWADGSFTSEEVRDLLDDEELQRRLTDLVRADRDERILPELPRLEELEARQW